MMYMGAIHVHVEEKRKHGKVRNNITPKIDECL
jgi:hypothetical protein